MRILLVPAVASLMALAAGCGSPAPLDPSASSQSQTNSSTTKKTSGAAGAGGASTTTTGTAGSTVVSPAGTGGAAVASGTTGITQPGGASMCDQPTGDRYFPSSIGEVQQALRGTWQLCSKLGLFDQPQAGIYIGDDDRYVFLDFVNGQLVAKTGLQNKGHVEYEDTSALNGPGFHVQVNFVSDMGTTIIAGPPIFSDVPRQLLIDNEGVETYTYAAVRATPASGTGTAGATGAGGTAGTGGSSELSQPSGASACDRPMGDRLPVSTIAEMQAAIRGTWQLCSRLGLFDQPQAGLFIGPDDRYVFLDLVGGTLVPKSGLENQGHLEYLVNMSTGGFGTVYFTSDLERTIIGNPPIFSADPRQMFIDNEGIENYTYGRVP